ncbi:MAG: GTPase Era [Thermodesulfobacteriota bacterium]
MKFRSGFIAIIGRPNVGKSTLLNAILGEKVAITSERPQTTRSRMRGVKNLDASQIVFIDTPGLHGKEGLMNAFMVKEALSSLGNVDGVLFMVEANRHSNKEKSKERDKDEALIVENLKRTAAPVLLVINKIDMINKDELLPIIDDYSARFAFKEVVPISATKGINVDELVGVIEKLLPEGPKFFPDDILTDTLERTLVAEIIREKAFRFTSQEIPYSIAVVIEEFKEKPKKKLIAIKATINVERDSQKGIVIGKGGKMLKTIGKAAREDMERLLGVKVFLELFVRVSKDWTRNKSALKEFGYD